MEFWVVQESRNFICESMALKTINDRGPSQDLWGIPLYEGRIVTSQTDPLTTITQYEWSHLTRQWGTPLAKNLVTNKLWSTLSNALAKSTDPPESRVEHQWCRNETKARLVDLPRRARNWLGSIVGKLMMLELDYYCLLCCCCSLSLLCHCRREIWSERAVIPASISNNCL